MEDVLKLCVKYDIPVLNYTDDEIVIDGNIRYWREGIYFLASCYFVKYQKEAFLERIENDMKKFASKRNIILKLKSKLSLESEFINHNIMSRPYINIKKDNFTFDIFINDEDDSNLYYNSITLPSNVIISEIIIDFIEEYFNLCYERNKISDKIGKMVMPTLEQMKVDSKINKIIDGNN